ncbi:MAG: ATP-binding protein [Spirochaetaceae bacterium]|nr:ATP-binding protein [Spirochaetaceae bacterium]
MEFLDRAGELRRLDNALRHSGAFAVIWGRRRVGKSRLLLEWSRRRDGLYTVADQSAPAVQRRYLAAAVAERFGGFADVEYPDWRSFFTRLGDAAARASWNGPFILDELPYLIAADPSLAAVLQNWLDRPGGRPCLVASGSSRHMMHGAVLDADAPLYGRAVEAFAVRPLRPGYLADVFTAATPRSLVSAYALWGGLPRYWELAEPYGGDLAAAVDELVLDPSGPLHEEPDRLLLAETPPATSLRPLLDAIGAGAHRISEIAGRLGKPASSLTRQLAALTEMDFVRREIPFGSSPASGKRSLYRLDDPFLRLWFAAVAPHRAALAEAPRDTRLHYWRRHRAALEGYAWEELCRMAVPELHRIDTPLAPLGPWEPARRYWRGNAPELDVVARSVDGRRLLVGEAKWSARSGPVSRAGPLPGIGGVPGTAGLEAVGVRFVPEASVRIDASTGVHLVDASDVLSVLRETDRY